MSTKQELKDALYTAIYHSHSSDLISEIESLIEKHAEDGPKPWDVVPSTFDDFYECHGDGGVCKGSYKPYWLHGNVFKTKEEALARVRVWKAEALIKRWCAHLWTLEPDSVSYWTPFPEAGSKRQINSWKNSGGEDKTFPLSMCTPFNPTEEHHGRIWLTEEIRAAYRTYFTDGEE